MEELCCRFPHLGDLVLNNLDEQSLTNCQGASRIISQFVIKERFFWIRIIQRYYKNLSKFKRYWEMIIPRTSADTLKQLAITLHNVCKTKRKSGNTLQWSPVHIAAETGLISLCTHVYSKSDIHQFENKNPGNKNGGTALHIAARKGHLEIYQFIMNKVEDKNPAANNGITPLHLAAMKGYLEIC